jgi:hypothetical protein
MFKSIEAKTTFFSIALFASIEEITKGLTYALSTKIKKCDNLFTRSFLIGLGFSISEVVIRYVQLFLMGKIPLFFLIIYGANTFIMITMAHTVFSYIFISGIQQNRLFLFLSAIGLHTIHNLISFGGYRLLTAGLIVLYTSFIFYFYFLNHHRCSIKS